MPRASNAAKMALKLFGWGNRAPRSKSAIVCCERDAALAKSCCVMPAKALAALQKSEADIFIAPLGFQTSVGKD